MPPFQAPNSTQPTEEAHRSCWRPHRSYLPWLWLCPKAIASSLLIGLWQAATQHDDRPSPPAPTTPLLRSQQPALMSWTHFGAFADNVDDANRCTTVRCVLEWATGIGADWRIGGLATGDWRWLPSDRRLIWIKWKFIRSFQWSLCEAHYRSGLWLNRALLIASKYAN